MAHRGNEQLAIGELAMVANANCVGVAGGTMAQLGFKIFIAGWVEDKPQLRLTFPNQPNTDRKVWLLVDEGTGAVNGVDNPHEFVELLVAIPFVNTFFRKPAIVRERA